MTPEEETLDKIKYVLSCGNEAQAIRLIEQYGHWKQEQTEQLNIHSVVGRSEQLKPLDKEFTEVLNDVFENNIGNKPTKKRF